MPIERGMKFFLKRRWWNGVSWLPKLGRDWDGLLGLKAIERREIVTDGVKIRSHFPSPATSCS